MGWGREGGGGVDNYSCKQFRFAQKEAEDENFVFHHVFKMPHRAGRDRTIDPSDACFTGSGKTFIGECCSQYKKAIINAISTVSNLIAELPLRTMLHTCCSCRASDVLYVIYTRLLPGHLSVRV